MCRYNYWHYSAPFCPFLYCEKKIFAACFPWCFLSVSLWSLKIGTYGTALELSILVRYKVPWILVWFQQFWWPLVFSFGGQLKAASGKFFPWKEECSWSGHWSLDPWDLERTQGVYQPGIPGVFRVFSKFGKVRKMLGNFHRNWHRPGELVFSPSERLRKDICSETHMRETQPTYWHRFSLWRNPRIYPGRTILELAQQNVHSYKILCSY